MSFAGFDKTIEEFVSLGPVGVAVTVALTLLVAYFVCLGAGFRLRPYHYAAALAAFLGGYLILGAPTSAILNAITFPLATGIVFADYCTDRPLRASALPASMPRGGGRLDHGAAAGLIVLELRTVSALRGLALLMAMVLASVLALGTEAGIAAAVAVFGIAPQPLASYGQGIVALVILAVFLVASVFVAVHAARCPHCGAILWTPGGYEKLFSLRQCPRCGFRRLEGGVAKSGTEPAPLPDEITFTYTSDPEEAGWTWRAAWTFKPVFYAVIALLGVGVVIGVAYAVAVRGGGAVWAAVVGAVVAVAFYFVFLSGRILRLQLTWVFRQDRFYFVGDLRKGRGYGPIFGSKLKAVPYDGGLLLFQHPFMAPIMLPPSALRQTDVATFYRFLADKGVVVEQGG